MNHGSNVNPFIFWRSTIAEMDEKNLFLGNNIARVAESMRAAA
jgi:hypothetical protein